MDSEELPILGESWPVELANSLYLDEGETYDFLQTPSETRVWFRYVESLDLPEPHSVQSNRRLRRLRDAIHQALAARLGGNVPERAVLDLINRSAELAPVIARLHWSPGNLPSTALSFAGSPFDQLCSRLAVATIELLSGAEGDQLRRCEGPGCSLLFVRHHKRRRFCHESCSHRDRQMRYYRRQKDRNQEGSHPKGGRS